VADLLVSARDGVDIITMGADVDVYTAPSLRATLADPDLIARGRLVIDLTGSTFIDPTGLSVILAAFKRVRAAGGNLAVACPPRETVHRAFRITGMNRILRIYDTTDEAVAGVKEASDG
jgi:anti-sigma B factor antagonist